MDTLNNQLIKMDAREGDEVLGDGWVGRVIMNEFGLGLMLRSSHEPQALCDGSFPAMSMLRLWKKKDVQAAQPKASSPLPPISYDNDMPLECSDD